MIPFALAFFFAQQSLNPPAKPAPNSVVATVDGAPITAAEIEPYLWAWKAREVATDLAAHRVIMAEAARKGLSATDAEVQAVIDEQLKAAKAHLAPGQTLEDLVAKQPGGMSRLALVARSRVLVDKIAELEFKPEAFVKVAFIAFPTVGDTTVALGKAIKSADAAYAALGSGKAWDVVLKANVQDPNAVASGGYAGWTRLATLPQSVQAQLAALKPLGVTKPIQTPSGLQIYRLLARGESANPAEAADLKAKFLDSARRAIVDRLRAAAKVEYK